MPQSTINTRSPFDDGPTTTESSGEGGEHQITVLPKAITPLRARLADMISLSVAVATAGAGIYSILQAPEPTSVQLTALLIAPVAAYFAAIYGTYKLFQKSARVVFTPELFTTHRMLGSKSFDRSMPHSFTLYYHEKKDREEELLSYKERHRRARWWSRPAKRYFGNSYYLSFEYMGQRNDLMLIYKHKKAQEILARLNACDDIMDGYSGKDRGQAMQPENEWASQAGDLEHVTPLGNA